jgi:hypothetical protein
MSRLETRLIPQDVLPFPPTPSASIVGRAMQEIGVRATCPRPTPSRRCAEHPCRVDRTTPGRDLPSTFGGEVRTGTLTRIHDEGIGYNPSTRPRCARQPARRC